MTVACPICQVALNPTANPHMLMCNRRKTFVPELNATLETTHAMIYVNPEGKQSFMAIEVLPYIFEIKNDEVKQTKIFKIIDPTKNHPREKRNAWPGPRSFERQHLITLEGVVHCDWHNRASVIDRVKMYMVFS